MVSQSTQATGERKMEAGGCKPTDNPHINVPYSESLETDGLSYDCARDNVHARPSNLRFLCPVDASLSASSGSSSPEAFYDAVDVLPLATSTTHVWDHDASAIQHRVTQVNTDYSHGNRDGEATPITQVGEQTVGRISRDDHVWDLNDDDNSWWGRNSTDKSFWEIEDPNKDLQGLPPSGLSASTTTPAGKPRARRPLQDTFVSYQYRLENSNLNEETRKIVQMLANDRVCKIDRPVLGLQDRLQSLAKCTAGKRTSYVKGPRVCSTLVKGIIKRSHDTMVQGRRNVMCHNANNREQAAHTSNLETSPVNWSIIKKGKKSKANDGKSTDICNKKDKTEEQPDHATVVGFPATLSRMSPTTDCNATLIHPLGSEVHGNTTKLSEVCSDMIQQPSTDTENGQLLFPEAAYSHVPENLTELQSSESVHTKRQKLDKAFVTANDNTSYIAPESKQLTRLSESTHTKKQKLSNRTDNRDHVNISPEGQNLTDATNDYILNENIKPDSFTTSSTCPLEASNDQLYSLTEDAPQAYQSTSTNVGNALDLQVHIASLHKVSHKLATKMSVTQRRNRGEEGDERNYADFNMESQVRKEIINNDSNSSKSSVTLEGHLQSNTLSLMEAADNMIQQVQKQQSFPSSQPARPEEVSRQEASKESSKMTEFRATEICLLSSSKLHHIPQDSAVKKASSLVKLQTDAISRLKTDNLMARYGGNNRLPMLLPTFQAYPAPHKDCITDLTPSPDSPRPKKDVRPPKPPLSRQSSKEDKARRLSQVKQACSRRGSLESRRGSRCAHLNSSPRTSLCDSFSQDLLRKCLKVAVDKCYSVEQEEEQAKEPPDEFAQLSQDELDKALKRAVCYHDADKARRLLDFGADPNVHCGQTGALLRAAREGALYVVQALLAAGADVDTRTEQGNSALHLAAREGFSEVVIQLVHSGAFVDAINRSGVTPLQVALAHGHLDVAYALLRLSADIFLKNKAGESAYDVANYLGYIGLGTGPRERRRDSAPGTFVEGPTREVPQAVKMIRGIEDGCAATVQDCLLAGAWVDTVVPLALHYPAQATVLHRAAHHGNDLIVQLLLTSGALVNTRDSVGNTPLHAAAQAGHNRVIKLLLKAGADLEAVSQSGMTPLHRAASKGKELTCNLLVRRGGSTHATDEEGRTPADWARKRGFKLLAKKLAVRRKSSATLDAQASAAACLTHLHQLHQQALCSHQDSQYEE